jgi:hypothetical protein
MNLFELAGFVGAVVAGICGVGIWLERSAKRAALSRFFGSTTKTTRSF